MSTSAIVGILENNKVNIIRNNNDSQPNDLGKWLFRNINEKKQILSLLRKGDASSITSNSFFKNTESEIYQYQDFLNYISDDHPASYFYLFDVSKNLWIVSNFKNPKKFVPLEGIVLNTKSFEESRNINKVSRFQQYLEAIKTSKTKTIKLYGTSNSADEYGTDDAYNDWEEGIEKAKEDSKGALKNLKLKLKEQYRLKQNEITSLNFKWLNYIMQGDRDNAMAIHYFDVSGDSGLIEKIKKLKVELED